MVVAGHFFRNIFGRVLGENVLPVAVVVSAFGNIAATSFAQARVNRELGRDGLLPFSRFFAGKKGDDDPVPGLFLHWFVSVLVIVVPPPGEIYNFLVDIGGYPVSVISVAISGGLLYLQLTPSENYVSPFKARKIYIVVFLLSNCLLLIMPWIKPEVEKGERFPYYAYPVTSLAILGSGVIYWGYWRINGGLMERRLHKEIVFENGGWEEREMKGREESWEKMREWKSKGVDDVVEVGREISTASSTGSGCACNCSCAKKRTVMSEEREGI